MSIEGMWAIFFGDVAGGFANSGVAVLETGRIFGGDSIMAYLGTYDVSANRVTAQARVWSYNPAQGNVRTAFGLEGRDLDTQVVLEGTIEEADNGKPRVVGTVTDVARRATLPCRLDWIAALP